MAQVNRLFHSLTVDLRRCRRSARTGKALAELADYMLPRKADITKKRTQGDKRTELIYDGTAVHAVELLSSSL